MAVGIMALVFGLAFLLVPGFTLVLFLYAFGLLLIISGIMLIAYSRQKEAGGRWRTLNLAEGAIVVILGLIALLAPGITALWAIYLFGAFAVITGILQIAEGIAAPKGQTAFGTSNRGLLVISGIWSLVIGVLLAVFPGAGILALLWLIGTFLIVVGILNIASGIKVHGEVKRPAASEER